jgi:hypothetical protein
MTPFETFYLIMAVIPVVVLTVAYIIDHRKKRSNSSNR